MPSLAFSASLPVRLRTPRPHFANRTPIFACEQTPELAETPVQDLSATNFEFSRTPRSSPSRPTTPSSPSSSSLHPSAPSPFVPQLVPGPPQLPVVGNALDILELPVSELMLSYARKYGDVVKFAILSDQMYLISSPTALQHIHATNAKNYLSRWTPPGFEVLLYNGRLRGLVFSQSKQWMKHRLIVGSVFRSSNFLALFVDVVGKKTSYLIDNILTPAASRKTVNIHQAMRMLTLDIIGEGAFGQQFGAMQNGSHPIETSLSIVLKGVLDVIKSPLPLWRFMNTPGRAAVQGNLERLQEIERGLIRERRVELDRQVANGEKVNDFLGRLLMAADKCRKEADGELFGDDDLMWDVHDVIFAGHETTASALAATMFLVAGSPRVLKCIQEEVNLVLGDRMPRMEDIEKLKYLDMVVNEALRLYPPTALVGRISKKEDVINGYRIPAGSNVLVSPYVMGRLEHVWDNVLEFRPERFLKSQKEKRHALSHTPFGAGPRVCLGARMAMMEAKVVLALIFRRFRFERTTDVLEVDYNSTVSFKSGMDMHVRKVEM